MSLLTNTAGATAPTVPAAARGGRRGGKKRRSPILTVVMLLCLCYFLLPLAWLLIASTKNNADLFSSFGLWFANLHFVDNVRDVFTFQDGVFWSWIRNTVLYAGIAGVGAAFFATAAGYAFAKYSFPGRAMLFSVVLGAIMIPATALAIPTYLLFAAAGITNTPLAVILPCMVSPFGVYLMRVYAADSVPSSIIEAARVDGASELRIFFTIALRLLAPGFVTVLLFAVVATWNNYFLPLIMLNTPDLFPLTVGLAQWQATAQGGSGSQALFSMVITGSFISIIPLVVAFLFLQRYWQSGLATGSIKQ